MTKQIRKIALSGTHSTDRSDEKNHPSPAYVSMVGAFNASIIAGCGDRYGRQENILSFGILIVQDAHTVYVSTCNITAYYPTPSVPVSPKLAMRSL